MIPLAGKSGQGRIRMSEMRHICCRRQKTKQPAVGIPAASLFVQLQRSILGTDIQLAIRDVDIAYIRFCRLVRSRRQFATSWLIRTGRPASPTFPCSSGDVMAMAHSNTPTALCNYNNHYTTLNISPPYVVNRQYMKFARKMCEIVSICHLTTIYISPADW